MLKEKYAIAGPLIDKSDIKEINKMMKSGWYGKNKFYYVEKFEKEFSKFHNRKYGLMTTNCTSAIHLALKAYGVKNGDEVIVPDITWIATATPIIQLGAKPIFADVKLENWCLDDTKIEKLITKKTKGIIAVDLYGNMPNMKKLKKICKKYNLFLFEDSAEALGSKMNNVRAGKFGYCSFFSFHRTKTITTGEGGMLLTDNKNFYNKCKFLRDNGRNIKRTYWCDESAFKYMPSNIQGCLGFSQLKKIKKIIKIKNFILQNYKLCFKNYPDVVFNQTKKNFVNGAWTTAIVWGKNYKKNAKNVIKKLNIAGLPARPFFYPLSSMKTFKSRKTKQNNPNSYSISSRGICLPSALIITKKEIQIYSKQLIKILTSK